MALAKITSRGQVTIPQTIRKAIGAKDGDELLFSITDNRRVLIEVLNKPKLTDLYASLPPRKPVSHPNTWRETAKRHIAQKFLGEEANG